MEDITDADYMHVKGDREEFEIKKLSEYHDFCLKVEILLLAYVFKIFKEMCLKIFSFRSCKISFSSWITMEGNLKND